MQPRLPGSMNAKTDSHQNGRKEVMMKKNRPYRFLVFFFLIFGLAGLGMLVGGFVVMYNSFRFQSTAVEVTGIITDIHTNRDSDGDTRHTVLVSYSYNGQSFEDIPLNYYSSGMYEGKEITLSVDPDAPSHMVSNFGSVFSYLLLLGMGLIFAAVGFIPLIFMLIRHISGKRLEANGQVLRATVERIDVNRSVTINGQHPYIIYCTYYDAYKDVTYRFKSKNLMADPSFDYAPGTGIDVYVSPEDYSKYLVKVEQNPNPKLIDYT